jgi:LCP family protein required for cell wall assembly
MFKKKPSERQSSHDLFSAHQTLPDDLHLSSDDLQAAHHGHVKRHRVRRFIITILALILIIGLSVGGWLGYKFARTSERVFGTQNILALLEDKPLNGEAQGRVNILLAGDSSDDPGHPGADLTDSIMVASIDTKNNTAFLLSIPRDLYVNIPGFGYAKINEAYQDGNSDNFSAPGYPNGGMGLLEEVVSQDLNMPIDYYALVDYTAFKDAVDAVGGITINIQGSDPKGILDRNFDWICDYKCYEVKYPNGPATLNGTQALYLARARGDYVAPQYAGYGFAEGDFERTENQRKMLTAVATKATSLGVLSNPFKIADLFDSVGNNVQTDLQLANVRRLYGIMKKVNANDIQSEAFNDANGTDLLANYTTSSGEEALIPTAGIGNYTQLAAFVAQLTGTSN